MSFISSIKKALGNFGQSIDSKVYNAMLEYIGVNSIIPLPENQETYIKKGYNYNVLLYSIISYITMKASDIPIKLYNKRTDELIESSPILELLAQPNSMQDYSEFSESALGYLLLTGNVYIYAPSPSGGANQGKPKELYVLPSQYMRIVAGDSPDKPIERYELSYTGSDQADSRYEADEIIHVKLTNYEYQNGENLYGHSPVKSMLRTLNKSNSNMDAMTKQAQNSGALGILMHDQGNAINDLSANQLKTVQNKVHKNISGSENKGKIHVTDLMFKWQQLGMSAADMQLLEDHKISRNDMCSVFKLSSMLFNDNSASTYNNMKEVRQAAYTDSIIPYMNRIIGELNRTLVKAFDPQMTTCLKLDLDNIAVLQKDWGEMVDYLSKAWWVSTQEKQSMMNAEVDENLPKYLIPSNLLPITGGVDEEIEEGLKRYSDYK